MSDEQVIHSVQMKILYRCVCMNGEGVDQETRLKVAPWIGRRFFSMTPPGSERKMLYTQSTQLREHWMEDDTKRLVLYVPKGAMVRVTTPPLVVPESEAQDYELVDLRKDLLLWNHDFAAHPPIAATILKVKKMAYWHDLANTAVSTLWMGPDVI